MVLTYSGLHVYLFVCKLEEIAVLTSLLRGANIYTPGDKMRASEEARLKEHSTFEFECVL